MSRSIRAAGFLLTIAGFAAVAAPPLGGSSANAATPERPNIVVIVTDDQAMGTMDAMPIVTREIRDAGLTIRNGFIPTSLCCPSRAALLSGRLAHSTKVYENVQPHGGWPTFFASGAEANTFAKALDDVGYRTALIGKYLNGFWLRDQTPGAGPNYIPPGWDRFQSMFNPRVNPRLAQGAYYGYELRGTEPTEVYGQSESDYSTDVLTGHAVDFLESTREPFLLYYSPFGAHAPFQAAPRHVGTWPAEPLSPAVTQLTRNRPDFMPDETLNHDMQVERFRRQHEALRSVDEGVGQILDAIGNRASNTLFVFLSDNGLQFGEHGLENKNAPYSGSTEVPMFLRWDGRVEPGSSTGSPVSNVDLTATILEAAGISMATEGVSVFSPSRPRGVLLEAIDSPLHPAYCGWRTPRYLFVEYADDQGQELYDYRTDPHELVNVAGRKDRAGLVERLRSEARAACRPRPPGFTWD